MGFGASGHEAGGYAHGRYERGLKQYRRRIRPLLAIGFGPFIVAGLAGLLLDKHAFAWLAGALFGLGAGAWIVMRESPPAYIENWGRGAEGEHKTERVLKKLDRRRWVVRHEVKNARGNYDHIVVGDAGVFMLDSKNYRGMVEISNGQPRLRRHCDPEADSSLRLTLSDARGNAARLKEDLQGRAGIAQWVQAVVVVWADFEALVHEYDNCVIVHGSHVRAWINNRPARLDEETVAALCAGVREL